MFLASKAIAKQKIACGRRWKVNSSLCDRYRQKPNNDKTTTTPVHSSFQTVVQHRINDSTKYGRKQVTSVEEKHLSK